MHSSYDTPVGLDFGLDELCMSEQMYYDVNGVGGLVCVMYTRLPFCILSGNDAQKVKEQNQATQYRAKHLLPKRPKSSATKPKCRRRELWASIAISQY